MVSLLKRLVQHVAVHHLPEDGEDAAQPSTSFWAAPSAIRDLGKHNHGLQAVQSALNRMWG